MHPTAFTMITTLRRGLAAVLIGLLATSLPAIAQGLGPNGLPLNPDAAPQARVGAQPSGSNAGGSLDELMAWERQDMGVRAPQGLHAGAMHGPTPNQIPGGQVITTKGLLPLLQQGVSVHVFDVLGGPAALTTRPSSSWRRCCASLLVAVTTRRWCSTAPGPSAGCRTTPRYAPSGSAIAMSCGTAVVWKPGSALGCRWHRLDGQRGS